MASVQRVHFGVYGIIRSLSGSEILLIEKARGPYQGLLDLPGGQLEGQESLTEALVREIREETGLTAEAISPAIADVAYYPLSDENNADVLRHLFVLYYVDAKGDLRIGSDGQDSAGARWISLKAIESEGCTPLVTCATRLLAADENSSTAS